MSGEAPYAPPLVSVVVPLFEHQAFLPRALRSLLRQELTAWEAVVVDDGSRGRSTKEVVARFMADARIRLVEFDENRGLAAACNAGLDATNAPLVAYLPADDLWAPSHLTTLVEEVGGDAVLGWAGMRHHGNRVSTEPLPDHGLQLVQVLHRRTAHRWAERDRFESDDLEETFFRQLLSVGPARGTGIVTCTWTDHPDQRHKHLRERFDGGLNVFRSRYRVRTPLRIRSRDGATVDEVELYAPFRRPTVDAADSGLRILLVGELAYNPERVLALRERGHALYGLWIRDTLGPHTVGPLPFPGVTDLPWLGWHEAVTAVRPDVVYAQQNWRAIPLAHRVLTSFPGLPLVFHFKESPQRSIRRGTWPLLRDLVTGSAGVVFASEEERDWFADAVEELAPTMVLDGDLPKRERFAGHRRPRLSEREGGRHVACVGRPVGIDADFVATLAQQDIHLHLHGLVSDRGPGGDWNGWLPGALERAAGYVHVHGPVPANRWVADLSVYDAGLLHRFTSLNHGDIAAAAWNDLNLPARMSTYAAARLPMLAPRQAGHLVAVQSWIEHTGAGILYQDAEHLARVLWDDRAMVDARAALERERSSFVFDRHADRLVGFLRRAVEGRW